MIHIQVLSTKVPNGSFPYEQWWNFNSIHICPHWAFLLQTGKSNEVKIQHEFMPPGIRKSICIKVEVSCPYIANKLFWNFNIGTLEPMTCIASSLGFSLVSNQKNLRVVSRLIWKKRQENTQEYFYSSNRLQEGESQWLCWPFTDLLFSFSNLYDVPQVDAGRDQQRAPVFTHWNLGFQNLSVEKRALQIRCWNVKYLKTRTSLDMHRHVK